MGGDFTSGTLQLILGLVTLAQVQALKHLIGRSKPVEKRLWRPALARQASVSDGIEILLTEDQAEIER